MALLLVPLLLALPAAADDDPSFRRTTPRGSFGREGPALLVGIPSGRAWGVESELIRVPAASTAFLATIEVRDQAIREAFVRVAWYDRATGRPKQFSLSDARLVRAGETATLEVPLLPPDGAVAYRVRVLARLGTADGLSTGDAVRVMLSSTYARFATVPLTRLLP